MSLIENLLQNKALVNAALSQLKKIIKSEGYEFVVISVDPTTDEIILNMYKPGEVVLSGRGGNSGVSIFPNPENKS